uniref:Uncharacterized protein n=1 Tax=Arundo donax TaxID=35708 RepID=A0A0A9EAQ1_ARUDO
MGTRGRSWSSRCRLGCVAGTCRLRRGRSPRPAL